METSQTAASHFTLLFALVATAISAGLYLRGLAVNRTVAAARYAYYAATAAIALAFGLLTHAFLTRDFSLAYVGAYSSADLSTVYTLSAVWAGQEGSFLLWTLLALVMGVVLVRGLGGRENLVMLFYSLPILALLVLLLEQSPFRLASGGPARGLNPLLQNPWMAIHPPAVFLGYAACAIPFALALAMLVRKEFDRFGQIAFAWVVFAWVTMGIGIILGGFWAYETLGWGGYWGWDPVENASLIPWLILGACLHGLVVQRRSNGLARLNYWMVVLAFVSVVYGTFLTRSGVLADFSVHSFPDLGITRLLVLVLVSFIAVAGAVFVLRRGAFTRDRRIEVGLNLPFLLLLAALLLLASALLVAVGTSSPLLTKLVGEPSKVSNDFYVTTNVPICLALMAGLAVSPYLEGPASNRQAAYLFAFATLAVMATSFHLGVNRPVHLAIVAVTSFTFFSQFLWIRRPDVALIHAGLALFILGSVYASGYETKDRLALVKDVPTRWNGYEVTLAGIEVPPDGRSSLKVGLGSRGDVWEASPKLYPNPVTGQMVASPAIRRGLLADTYLAAEQYDPGTRAEDHVALARGEARSIGPYSITFKGFRLEGAPGSGEPISLSTELEISAHGRTWTVAPPYEPDGAARPALLEEGGEYAIAVEQIEPPTRSIILTVLRPVVGAHPPAMAVVSAMNVPLINLVWLGSILATIGGIWSFLRHSARSRAASAPPDESAGSDDEPPLRRAAAG